MGSTGLPPGILPFPATTCGEGEPSERFLQKSCKLFLCNLLAPTQPKREMMIDYPLSRAHRLRIARAFANVPSVDISVDCVIEDQMGEAFVDSMGDPQLFLIDQDHFFCYFAGNLTSDAGRGFLGKAPKGRLYMAGSAGWHDAVQDIFGEEARPIERYSYSSESLSLDHLRSLSGSNPHTSSVQRMDATLVGVQTPFFEIGAFDSPDDFVERGIGFCMLQGEQIIGVAYSSLVCSSAIEVSIFVDEDHRRQGIATALACQLLLWCVERTIAPHWDAANEESCLLAEKVGYTSVGKYTAYFVKG